MVVVGWVVGWGGGVGGGGGGGDDLITDLYYIGIGILLSSLTGDLVTAVNWHLLIQFFNRLISVCNQLEFPRQASGHT